MARRGAEAAEQENLFMEINEITGIIIQESIKIHRDVGPGLMESVYEELLYYRLVTYHQLNVSRQGQVNLMYEGVRMNVDLRYDLMVEGKVLVELKSQETVPPVAYKILKTYLRLTNTSVGLMINFNVEILKDGIKRMVNNYVEE